MSTTVLIDYENIPSQVNTIKSSAQQINEKLINIYGYVKNLSNYWEGTRYNNYAKSFNELITTLNQFLKTIAVELPETYYSIANYFSNIDVNNPIVTQGVDYTPLNEISLKSGSTTQILKFLTTNINDEKNKINSSFKDIMSILDSILGQVNKIQFQCDGVDAFLAGFRTFIEKSKEMFNEIMNNSNNSIQSAETYFNLTENVIKNPITEMFFGKNL